MAKPRAKTLQERMGFMEDDLTTPGHDAIMLWLDENIGAYLPEWLEINTWDRTSRNVMTQFSEHWGRYLEWTKHITTNAQEEIAQADTEADPVTPEDRIQAAIQFMNHGRIQQQIDAEQLMKRVHRREGAEALMACTAQLLGNPDAPLSLPPFPGIKVMKKVWEHPLTTTREYTIGFIDLMVVWGRPLLDYVCPPGLQTQHEERWYYRRWDEWEPWEPAWQIGFVKHEAAFEVKTTIPSLGELLRQLKLYEQHFTGRIFVVAPDARFAEKIREQGFGFIQSPNNL